MTVRSGLTSSGILAEVTRLLGTSDWFDDNTIQAALDRHRFEHLNTRLTARAQLESGGMVYKVWDIPSYIESPAFTDLDYATVTPNTEDYLTGRIEFTSSQDDPYLLLKGFEHDPYGAAADLLEVRAVQIAGKEKPASFSGANGSYSAGRFADYTPRQLRETAAIYRKRAKALKAEAAPDSIQVVQFTRDDIA